MARYIIDIDSDGKEYVTELPDEETNETNI